MRTLALALSIAVSACTGMAPEPEVQPAGAPTDGVPFVSPRGFTFVPPPGFVARGASGAMSFWRGKVEGAAVNIAITTFDHPGWATARCERWRSLADVVPVASGTHPTPWGDAPFVRYDVRSTRHRSEAVFLDRPEFVFVLILDTSDTASFGVTEALRVDVLGARLRFD